MCQQISVQILNTWYGSDTCRQTEMIKLAVTLHKHFADTLKKKKKDLISTKFKTTAE
jgi:hypothetical protein